MHGSGINTILAFGLCNNVKVASITSFKLCEGTSIFSPIAILNTPFTKSKGIFTGKGIYDLEVFDEILDNAYNEAKAYTDAIHQYMFYNNSKPLLSTSLIRIL